jgi:Lon protease-like protein
VDIDLPDLGLFPLELVVLPGERVPLHLFEPRYRQLYADCVMEEQPFVILQAGPTGTADVGCACRFETLVSRFEDGRLNVVARGVEPVAVVEETDGRLYFSARVRPLADEGGPAAEPLRREILTRFRALAGLPDDAVPEAPEGVPLSYAIGGALDMPGAAKQEMLESRDESHRLTVLMQVLESADREVRHARMAAERAGSNGKVSIP